MAYSFVKPNTRALPRSQRITEEIWERHREGIIQEFKLGGRNGNKQALEWIKSQNIPDFNPSARQLRHRIQEVWKEDIRTGTDDIADPSITNEHDRVQSPTPRGTVKRILESQLKRANVFARATGEMVVPNPTESVSPVAAAGKKHGQITDFDSGRQHKRQKEENLVQKVKKTLLPKVDEESGRYGSQNRSDFSAGQVVAGSNIQSLNGATANTAKHTYSSPASSPPGFFTVGNSTRWVSAEESLLQDSIKDPVLEPSRLQRILGHMGIDWHVDIVSQCLRKDIVFRTSTPPMGLLPIQAYSPKNIERMKAYAEYLFGSSNPEKAFPLFLQVWIKQRGDFGNKGIKVLIQCARCAALEDDRRLMQAVLEQELSLLDRVSAESQIIRPLVRLELSRLFRQHNNVQAGDLYHHKALSVCPERIYLISKLDEARRQLRPTFEADGFISDIVGEAFTCSGGNGYTICDVLLIILYLLQHNPLSVMHGIEHIRHCLKHAATTLGQLVETHRSPDRLSVFSFLIRNWSARPFAFDDLSFDEENSCIGMSTIEVISIIALVLETNKFPGVQDGPVFPTNERIGARVSYLLHLPNDTLVLGCLWLHSRSTRERVSENVELPPFSLNDQNMASLMFYPSAKERGDLGIRESVMTVASASLSIAKSFSSSSTLSSMRRQSRMSRFSAMTQWSDRTTTNMDELAERSSLLTISDGAPSRPPSENVISTSGEVTASFSHRFGYGTELLFGVEEVS